MVYIEYVIIDNLVIDYLIVRCSSAIMSIKPKRRRYLFAVMFGTFCAIVLPLVEMPYCVEILCKFFCAVLMVIIYSGFTRYKKFLLHLVSFFGVTFVFGGICFMISLISSKNNSLNSLPVFVPILICFLTYLFFKTAISEFKKRRIADRFLFDVELFIRGKSNKMRAFLDTGNRLFSKKNEPIVVVTSKMMLNFFSSEELTEMMINGNKSGNVEFKCVGGKINMPIVVAEKILIYNSDNVNIIDNVAVGIHFSRFDDCVKYDMLLNPQLII